MLLRNLLVLIFLFSFIDFIKPLEFKTSRNNPQTVTIAPQSVGLKYSSPWYLDNTPPSVCDSYIDIELDSQVNGVLGSNLLINMHGGQGSTACFTYPTPTVTYNLAFKVMAISQVYELDSQEWCGSYAYYDTYKDPYHPEITNGISCHCPGGVNNYKFSECPPGSYDSSNLTFYDSLPSSTMSSTVRLCHNMVVRGTAKGCLIDSDASTDYSLKFSTDWEMHPIFRLRSRPILETIIGIYEGVPNCPVNPPGPCITNWNLRKTFNISTLTSQSLSFDTIDGTLETVINYGSIKPLKDLLPDYTITSQNSDFTDVTKIYLIDTDNFNVDNDLDPLKVCAIRAVKNSPLQYNKWEMDKLLGESFSAKQCHKPAEGLIQSPFQKIGDYQTEANKLTSRLNPEIVDFMPNGQQILKIKSQAAITFYSRITPSASSAINNIVDIGTVKDFQITCLPSYNEEGFPCSILLTVDTRTRVEIQTKDTEQTVTTMDVIGSHQAFKFFLPYSMAGKNYSSICANGPLNEICQTVTLIDRYSDPIVQPQVNDTEDDFNDQGGGNIFQNGSGKLHTWIIIIIVIASVIGFIIMLVLCMPLLKFLFYAFKKFFTWMSNKLKEHKEKAVAMVYEDKSSSAKSFQGVDLANL